MKKVFLIFVALIALVFITSCDFVFDETPSTNEYGEQYEIYKLAQEAGYSGTYEEWLESIKGEKGDKGEPGKGIESIEKINTEGLVDTYTIYYTDGSETTFIVTNGKDGHTPEISIRDGYWYIDGVNTEVPAEGAKGEQGASVSHIEFNQQGQLIITLSDGTVLDPVDLPKQDEHIHSFTEWYCIKKPTCEERGIDLRLCEECNYTESRLIDKMEHEYVETIISPTCTEKGYTMYTCHCSHTYLSDYVDAIGHNYGKPEYIWNNDDRSLAASKICLNDFNHVEVETVVATYDENDPNINKLNFSSDINTAFFDLSNRFKQMVQPSWIDYNNGGKTGVAEFVNGNASTQSHKCGVGHVVYLCNRTFIFSNNDEYEMVVVKMDENQNIIENTGWIKGPYIIDKNECAWFSIILRSANSTSIVNKLSDVVSGLTVLVSEEEIDKKSDFPLVLGIVNFETNGVMLMDSTFTTYNGFNTFGLAYPITNEEMIEQTNRLTTWNQSFITYDATNGKILQKPQFYNSMTWVATLNNENLFVLWKKSDNAIITYNQAVEASENISIKKVDNESNTWIMNLNSNFKVSSHRIDAQLAPRNTYSALESAYNRGYRWFESDIHLTKDLVPVMLHDRNISFVSNGNANIDTLTYEEALQYDFGSWHSPKFAGEKILRLEDMLKFCAEHDCGLNLEFKSSSVPTWNVETIGIVYDLIKKYGMEDKVMFNGNGAEITYLKIYLENFDDTVEVQWLPGSINETNIALAKELQTGKNVVRICVPWSDKVTKELVDSAMSQGILIDVHCVSSVDAINPNAFEEMLSIGIAGIITESANTTFYIEELE